LQVARGTNLLLSRAGGVLVSGVLARGEAVQVDSIKTRVESAYGFRA